MPSPLQTLSSSHLLPYDLGSLSSWSPSLPCSPKARSPSTSALPKQEKDLAVSWPQSQPSVCLEILPEDQEVISFQHRLLPPGMTSLNLTCESPPRLREAGICALEKQCDIARTLNIVPKPWPPQQESCPLMPSLFNKDRVSVYGVFLDFLPHSSL